MEHLKELNMKLQSSIEFGKTLVNETDSEYRRKRDLFDNFIEQPLTLGMFVPCVDNEPFNYSKHGNQEQFEQAKERVLFDGFNISSNEPDSIDLEHEDIFINYNKEEDIFFIDSFDNESLIINIECLVNLINYTTSNLTLTKSAQKQIM